MQEEAGWVCQMQKARGLGAARFVISMTAVIVGSLYNNNFKKRMDGREEGSRGKDREGEMLSDFSSKNIWVKNVSLVCYLLSVLGMPFNFPESHL